MRNQALCSLLLPFVTSFCISSTNCRPNISLKASISTDTPTVATLPADWQTIASTPLSPHTLAGRVEALLLQEFSKDDIDRVLQSWRLLEAGYQHKQDLREDVCQECHSFVPNLPIQPFWDLPEWLSVLEDNFETMQSEWQAYLSSETDWDGATTEHAASYGPGWSTLGLMDRGVWDERCKKFPQVSKLIYQHVPRATEVLLARMQPHSQIATHTDHSNLVLTAHVGLDVPTGKVELTVGDETRAWQNGKCMLFDTSLLHSAVNDSPHVRTVLMMRVWHPGLTDTECQALQLVMDCLNCPDVGNPEQLRQIRQLRQFPLLSKGGGFGGGTSKKKKGKKRR